GTDGYLCDSSSRKASSLGPNRPPSASTCAEICERLTALFGAEDLIGVPSPLRPGTMPKTIVSNPSSTKPNPEVLTHFGPAFGNPAAGDDLPCIKASVALSLNWSA